MKNVIGFLRWDIDIQIFLFLCVGLSVILYPFIGFTLVALGAWQLLSAIIVGVALKDYERGIYLLFSFCYLLMMANVASFENSLGDFSGLILLSTFIIIPICIAVWYLRLTKRTHAELTENRIIEYRNSDLEDILDIDEVLK